MGFDAGSGIDLQLRADALARGLEAKGDEDAITQILVLAEMPEQDQLAALNHLIGEYDTVTDDFVAQIDAWMASDLTQVERATAQIKYDIPGLYEAMFPSRNRHFADEIEQLLDGQADTLVALGLGHFVGPQSILEILQLRGHLIETR